LKKIYYLLLLPYIFLLFFVGYLVYFMAVLSLMESGSSIYESKYVGIENYIAVFNSPYFYNALLNTFIWTAGNLTLTVILGLVGALAANELEGKLKEILMVLIMIPWFMPWGATAMIWKHLWTTPYGIFGWLVSILGLIKEGQAILTSLPSAFIAPMITETWKIYPLGLLMLYAGLRQIPKEIYESAQIDGGGGFLIFRYITIPLLKPIIITYILLNFMWIMGSFAVMFILTGGAPGYATELYSLLIYRKVFLEIKYHEGAALSMILFVILFTIGVLTTYFYKKEVFR
jgi:multiple sugar transport system permease protein